MRFQRSPPAPGACSPLGDAARQQPPLSADATVSFVHRTAPPKMSSCGSPLYRFAPAHLCSRACSTGGSAELVGSRRGGYESVGSSSASSGQTFSDPLALFPQPPGQGLIEGSARRRLLVLPDEVLAGHRLERRVRRGLDLGARTLRLADQERPRETRQHPVPARALHG